jgi:hypothetical protein
VLVWDIIVAMSDGEYFHVELRQFPGSARAFNLTQAELRRRFVDPWIAGRAIELDERRWSPEKAKLTIYEAPHLPTSQMGLGRGWANVTKDGRDVTGEMLAQAQSASSTPADEATQWVKGEVERLPEVSPQVVLALLNARHPGWRPSDRLAVAERAIWELLHRGELQMRRDGELVDPGNWEELILAWETWTGPSVTLQSA